MKKAKTILVVEDEAVLLQALVNKLTKEKFHVLTAKNGADGLAMALAEKPDLIILDIIMPVMDGMTMLSKLREDSWGATAKVIILTNLGEAEKVSLAMSQGVHDFLIKADWKLEDVIKKIREII